MLSFDLARWAMIEISVFPIHLSFLRKLIHTSSPGHLNTSQLFHIQIVPILPSLFCFTAVCVAGQLYIISLSSNYGLHPCGIFSKNCHGDLSSEHLPEMVPGCPQHSHGWSMLIVRHNNLLELQAIQIIIIRDNRRSSRRAWLSTLS